jgi:hypothetical protein
MTERDLIKAKAAVSSEPDLFRQSACSPQRQLCIDALNALMPLAETTQNMKLPEAMCGLNSAPYAARNCSHTTRARSLRTHINVPREYKKNQLSPVCRQHPKMGATGALCDSRR